MAELMVEDLAKLYRRELTEPELLELPEEFYQEVGKLVSRFNGAKREDPLQKELLEEQLKDIVFLAEGIHNTRVLKSIDRIAGGEVPASVMERERTAFLEMRQSLERLRSDMLAPALSGKMAVQAPTEKMRSPVVMLSDVDERILGTDRKYYGPFKSGEVVNLPETNADFMVKHEFAKRIKVKA